MSRSKTFFASARARRAARAPIAFFAALAAVAGCDCNETTFTVGGTVVGITGPGLVLQNNGRNDLAVAADGSFIFTRSVDAGDTYEVTVLHGPGAPEQSCEVNFGRGTATGDVTDVEVTCVAAADDIADAVDLAEGIERRFSTVGSTNEAGEVVCGEVGTVWFDFEALSDGDYVAYATGSDHDTELSFSDALAGPNYACNDDADDSYDAVDQTLTLMANDRRYVQLGVDTEHNTGTGSVGVTRVIAAADAFDAPTPLELRAGALTAVAGIDFVGTEASEVGEASMCGSDTLFAASAWLTFTPPFSGTWMLESKSSDETDIAVFTGTAVGASTLLNCATRDHVAVSLELVAGTTYHIRIGITDPMTDDAVVVRAERTPTQLSATVVDTDGDGSATDVGRYSDIAVVGGEPAIAYYDGTNRELRYAARGADGTWTDVLIDADGDGTSVDVGQRPSLAVLSDGRPAVVYFDATNGELRFAERSAALAWTDVLIDADGDGSSASVGSESALVVLANGNPAVAYYDGTNRELRYAERTSGIWADSLVDADGGGTSGTVGRYPGIVELSGGVGVAYTDDDNSELRFARLSAGTWSDELVYADSLDPSGLIGGGVVLDSRGHPVIAATDEGLGSHIVASWNGTTWNVEWDNADRHIAELDFNSAPPQLLIDENDVLHLVWTDSNYAGTMAVSTRSAPGSWTVRDVVASSDPSLDRTNAVWSTNSFGATFMPDGSLAVSFQDDSSRDLFCAVGR